MRLFVGCCGTASPPSLPDGGHVKTFASERIVVHLVYCLAYYEIQLNRYNDHKPTINRHPGASRRRRDRAQLFQRIIFQMELDPTASSRHQDDWGGGVCPFSHKTGPTHPFFNQIPEWKACNMNLPHHLHTAYTWISDHLSDITSAEFWIHLLEHYRYPIVILGALVEGEMVLILAGGAAYHGYMSLTFVILTAFVGAVIHDHLLFFLGRYCGQRLLNFSPRWHRRIDKVSHWIQKYDQYFIMSFRFVYGLRTVTPLLVGQSTIRLRRYSRLVSLSALIWAVAVSGFGYLGASALTVLSHDFDHYKRYLAIGIIALVALVVGGIGLYKRYQRR